MKKIYLLPGLMTDERLWCRLKPLLEKDYELVHVPIPLVEDFDKACIELDNVFKEEKINLLGFSLGSYLASYFAIKNPKKIDKLFLLAGSASFIDDEEVKKRELSLIQMDKFGFKGLSRKKVISLIEEKSYEDEELINTIKDMYSELGFKVFKAQMELSFKRVDISEELTSLEFPIKLYYSSDDRLFNYSSLAKLKEKNKGNITFVQREGKSHMLSLEDSDNLAKEIKEWVSKG